MSDFVWIPVSDLRVQAGGFYRFVALFPSGMTQDQAYAALCGSSNPASCTKWDITSIGAPPPDVAAALNATGIVFPNAQPPVAFYFAAVWIHADQTLAKQDPTGFYYEQLAVYSIAATGEPVDVPTTPSEADQPSSGPAAPSELPLALLGLAIVVPALWWALSRKPEIPYARPHVVARAAPKANPATHVQTITATVNGRPVKFDIDTDGARWTAVATIVAGRRRKIVGSGGSKAEALQSAIGLASAAFATADVRA